MGDYLPIVVLEMREKFRFRNVYGGCSTVPNIIYICLVQVIKNTFLQMFLGSHDFMKNTDISFVGLTHHSRDVWSGSVWDGEWDRVIWTYIGSFRDE